MSDTENVEPSFETVEKMLRDSNKSLNIDSEEFKSAVGQKPDTEAEPEDDSDDDTPEVDEENDDEDASEEDVEEEEKPRSKENKAAEKFRKLRQENLRLKREMEQAQKAEPQEERQEKREPTSERPQKKDYDTYDEYIEAVTEWKFEQKIAEKSEIEQRQSAEAKQRELTKTWVDREKSIQAKYSDYGDVVTFETVEGLNIGPGGRHFLNSETDNGPEILYNLLEDDDLREKFVAASPVKQVAMLARLEAKFETPKSTKKTVKALPEPPPKMSAGKNVRSAMSFDDLANSADMDDTEWIRRFEKARKRNRF